MLDAIKAAIARVRAALPEIHDDWKLLLARASSVRAAMIGATLAGLQGALYALDLSFLPQWLFIVIVLLLFVAVPVLRILIQPSLAKDDGDAG